jgi:tryptophan synthase alpha chain
MNRISRLFEKKSSNILNIYCTAGYPGPDSTMPVMLALQQNGVDMIELGMPYSDPLADGPVIQQSSMVALSNGMSVAKLLEDLKDLRPQITVPVILMGYMNPVLQYGFELFCRHASEAGVDGLILPDLPIYEYETEYGAVMARYGLRFIFLVTPETSEERIRKIDALSDAFIYAVSSSSTTGNDGKGIAGQEAYFRRLQDMKLKNPVLVGFGIRDKKSFELACRYTSGAIIGTAYIKTFNENPVQETTRTFVEGILK